MGRYKKKTYSDIPKPVEFELVQVLNVIQNLLKVNYEELKITKYRINSSPDRTRIALNAVIDTPFPDFEEREDIIIDEGREEQ